MKYVFVNLKRFDIPIDMGGINRSLDILNWGSEIVSGIDEGIKNYNDALFAVFFPEAHIIKGMEAKSAGSIVQIGCQSVHFADVEKGGNFGGFTGSRTARSMKALGCGWTIIGHCEERRDLRHIIGKSVKTCDDAVSMVLNEKVRAAVASGLKVLFCVGETADEQPDKYTVIKRQIELGLSDIPCGDVVIGYEPVWAIGPGKIPPGREYIDDIARFIKGVADVPVVYGGGLKEDNAEMLASIPSIDGGLIALTRFNGEIGFYPEEYLEIVRKYFKNATEEQNDED
ncbi:MAG: triosephosphate isomerase [Clostridia bacterium]|nr:triosephosphate isomerase [Clostridia bacterium]